jgi:hypothetical protein
MLPRTKSGPTSVAPAPTTSQIYNEISFFMVENDTVAPPDPSVPKNMAVLA